MKRQQSNGFISLFPKAFILAALALNVSCSLDGTNDSNGKVDTTPIPIGNGKSLPNLGAQASSVTVSGVSAGAYMATQLQMAYSKTFKGLGSIAGGPWNCAQGLAWHATGRCMERAADINTASLLEDASRSEARGDIDPLSQLRNIPLYLLNSPNDSVVRTPMIDKNREFFGALVSAATTKVETAVASDHSFPTIDYGLPCDETGSPFLSACGFDTAGAVLQHVLPNLPLVRAEAQKSSLHTFDQTEFGDRSSSLAKEGLIYIPARCATTESRCPVHVALHGCSQGSDAIKDVFALHAGYNEWAEGSGLIILYPQTYARPLINPNGCFDWWGYTGANYATKKGHQMTAIKEMVDRLLSKAL